MICALEVTHKKGHGNAQKRQTRSIADTLTPKWDETFEIAGTSEGDTIEFTILDQGTLGTKTQGKASIPHGKFSPRGFEGALPISGLAGAMLHVRISPTDVQDILASLPAVGSM